jgi:hypothetical protein
MKHKQVRVMVELDGELQFSRFQERVESVVFSLWMLMFYWLPMKLLRIRYWRLRN